MSLGVIRPCAELAARVRLDGEGQLGIYRNIHAVILIQSNSVAVCIGDFHRTALCREIDLYKPADFRKTYEFCLDCVFFGSKPQCIAVRACRVYSFGGATCVGNFP